MKKATLLIALIGISTHAFAQKQWLSLSLLGYSGNNQKSEMNSGITQSAEGSSVVIYPAISYNRFLGKDWGLGLELGYRSYNVSYDDSYPIGNGDVGTTHSRHSEKMYRISPSLFQNYVWKKYRGIASFSIPLELRAEIEDETSRSYTQSSGQSVTTNRELYISPRQLSIGAFVNLGVQRQIAGGLYFGPQLGFGIVRTSSNGTASSKMISVPASGPVSETVQNTDVRNVQSAFTFMPSLNLCYYF